MNNLFSIISNITSKVTLSELANFRIGINGNDLFYKTYYNTFDSSDINSPKNAQKIISYLNKYLQELINQKIKPIIVFNGCVHPLNKKEIEEQIKFCNQQLALANDFKKKEYYNASFQYFLNSLYVDFGLVQEWIKELRVQNIEYYVAPFEADAQLAYFSRINYIDSILVTDLGILQFMPKFLFFQYNYNKNYVFKIKFDSILEKLDLNLHEFIIVLCLIRRKASTESFSPGIIAAIELVKKNKTLDKIQEYLIMRYKNKISLSFISQLQNRIKMTLNYPVYDINKKCMIVFNENNENYDKIQFKTDIEQFIIGNINPSSVDISNLFFDNNDNNIVDKYNQNNISHEKIHINSMHDYKTSNLTQNISSHKEKSLAFSSNDFSIHSNKVKGHENSRSMQKSIMEYFAFDNWHIDK